MDILSTISQSCDSLTASPASAAIATSGHGLALGLGLCVIVYEGVNVSLNAHRGHHIDLMRLGRSLLGVLVVIALVQFYRSEEHTSELQSLRHLVCRLLLEKKNNKTMQNSIYPTTTDTYQRTNTTTLG